MGKIDEFFICVIFLEGGERYLQNNRKVLLRRPDRVDLVGIDDHELPRCQWISFLIEIKFQLAFIERKNLDGTVSVLLPHIVPVPSFEYEHFKRNIIVYLNHLM
jgi:hypothetical protein